jgi:hypothetical protein
MLIIETTIWKIPFVLLLLLQIAIFFQIEWTFFIALLLGIFVDALSFRQIGTTSIFFLGFLLLIFLYEQKFELRTPAFVILMSFLGSFFYCLFFLHTHFLSQVLLSIIIGVCFFACFSFFLSKEKKKSIFKRSDI